MSPERIEKALKRVVEHCDAVISMDFRVSDEEIEMAETVLSIINEELKK